MGAVRMMRDRPAGRIGNAAAQFPRSWGFEHA